MPRTAASQRIHMGCLGIAAALLVVSQIATAQTYVRIV